MSSSGRRVGLGRSAKNGTTELFMSRSAYARLVSWHKMDSAQTHKRRRPGATEGEWWRFSSYEIRQGCIRPAERAKLEWYDPWPDFQHTRTQTIGQAPAAIQPAYQSLIKLVRQLEYFPGNKSNPDC